jgi:hypothetical protein
MSDDAHRYLGPATVSRAVGDRIEVTCDELGDSVLARSALAYPYQPVRGDELLVIGDRGSCFIIGVLVGRGRPRIAAKQVSLRAEGGSLRLSAGRAVVIAAKRADVVAQDDVFVQSHHATRQTRRLSQRILEKVETLSRDYDQVIDRGWVHHARRITAKVKKTFYINGGRIRLS